MVPGTYTSIIARTTPAIEFIGNAGKNVSTGSQSITYHASSASGDLLILIVQADDVDTIPTPSGWTRIFNSSDGRGGCRGFVAWKIKASDTKVFVSDVGDHQTASVLTFRNTATTSPIEIPLVATVYPYSGINGGSTIPGAISTIDNSFVCYVVIHDNDSNSACTSGWTNAQLSSTAELIDISTNTGWDGGFAVWGGFKASAGNTGVTGLTITDTGGYAICFPMVIKPIS